MKFKPRKFDSEEIVPIGNESLYIVNTGAWRKKRPVVDKEKCIKCSICYQYCPVFAIVQDDEGYYVPTYDYCKGCGVCANECPKDAIMMIPEPTEGGE